MNNITRTGPSSSNPVYIPPNRHQGVANQKNSQIRYNGNLPTGKKRRVRPPRPEVTGKVQDTGDKQVRSLQQTLKNVVVSSAQSFFNATAVRFNQCVSGAGGMLVSISNTFKRSVYLFDANRQGVQHHTNASSAITAQLPNLGSTGLVEVSCENEYYHMTSTIYPQNTTLFHAAIKNQALVFLEYNVGQMHGVLARSFRAAKLLGDTAGISFLTGNTNQYNLVVTNSTTNKFQIPGQYLNEWSSGANILALKNGEVRIFQYATAVNNQDLPLNGNLQGINHINNQTLFICPVTPVDGPKVGLISGTVLEPVTLWVYDTVTNTTTLSRVLDDNKGYNPPVIADYGNGIYVYVREFFNVNTTIDFAYDFVDANNNMTSVIGGEQIIETGVYGNLQPKVGVTGDGTAIITYLDESSKPKYRTLYLADQVPSPSIEILSPVVPTPELSPSPILGPSIIVLPPINLNQTYVPITPEIIKLEGNIINITITDKNGYEFVFNANCSVVDECVPLTVTDLYQISIALKNGTVEKLPQITACSIDICAKSVADSQLQQQVRLDDKTWIIAVPVTGGVLVLIAIGGVVYYFKKHKKIEDEHRRKNEVNTKRLKNTKDKMREVEKAQLEEKAQKTAAEVAQATTTQTFQGSAKYNKKNGDIV